MSKDVTMEGKNVSISISSKFQSLSEIINCESHLNSFLKKLFAFLWIMMQRSPMERTFASGFQQIKNCSEFKALFYDLWNFNALSLFQMGFVVESHFTWRFADKSLASLKCERMVGRQKVLNHFPSRVMASEREHSNLLMLRDSSKSSNMRAEYQRRVSSRFVSHL